MEGEVGAARGGAMAGWSGFECRVWWLFETMETFWVSQWHGIERSLGSRTGCRASYAGKTARPERLLGDVAGRYLEVNLESLTLDVFEAPDSN